MSHGLNALDVRKLDFWAGLNPTLSPARADGGLVQFGSFASDNLGIQRTGCYTVLDMEEEAIITEVRPRTQRSLGEGLDINFLQVSFRVLRRSRYEDHGYKVTLKSPAWLSQLEPSAPPRRSPRPCATDQNHCSGRGRDDGRRSHKGCLDRAAAFRYDRC